MRLLPRRSIEVALLLCMALPGCHPNASTPGGKQIQRSVITQEEIEASDAGNVYDLIAHLRSEFLRDRGVISIKQNTHSRAVVFLNDQEYGILETLRNMPPNRISEIRYLTGIEAAAKYGSQYGGGVILLISRVE